MIASLMGIEILNISVALHDWQRGEYATSGTQLDDRTQLSSLR
jgi:hypothetical protein